MKERDRRIDFLKGIGILLVIVGHMQCPVWLKTGIYLFHMPLFFFISGYLFDHSATLWPFTKKKAISLLYPYFIFGCLYIAFEWLVAILTGQESGILFLKKHILALLYGNYIYENNVDYIGVLWFLVCLFCASFIYKCISRAFSHAPIKRLLSAMIVAVLGYLLGNKLYSSGIRLPWCLDIAFTATGMIAIGDMFHHMVKTTWSSKKISIKSMLLSLPAGLLCGGFNVYLIHRSGRGLNPDMLVLKYGSLLLFFSAAILLCFFLVSVAAILYSHGKHFSLIERCGTLSILIMITHLKCQKILDIVFSHFHIEIGWIIDLILVAVLSFLVSAFIEKYIPYLLKPRRRIL